MCPRLLETRTTRRDAGRSCAPVALLSVFVIVLSAWQVRAEAPKSAREALARLAEPGKVTRIDSIEEFKDWVDRLRPVEFGPRFAETVETSRRELFRLLVRNEPIAAPGVDFAGPLPVLERLQSAAVELCAKTSDKAYLPALKVLYERQIRKGHWTLVEQARIAIRQLGGSAPDRPTREGPEYYQWLKSEGHFTSFQPLDGEPSLDESASPAGPRLCEQLAAEFERPAPFDDARATRIAETVLPGLIQSKYLHGSLARWIRFDAEGHFRLTWSANGARIYLQGRHEKPELLIVVLDEQFADRGVQQARLGDVLTIQSHKPEVLADATRDALSTTETSNLRLGVRETRQGRFTVARLTWRP